MHLFAFSLRQALEGLWRNRVMSLAATVTMVMMLILLSSLVIVLSGMQAGVAFVESKVEIRAELAEGAPQERVDALATELRELPEVASVAYVTKEEALDEFNRQRAEAGEQDLSGYITNPFPARLSVRLVDPRRYEPVMVVLDGARGPVVAQVIDSLRSVDRLVSVTATLRTVGVAVLLLVGLTVLLIVVNSIRMAVMSRAQEIEIMRLVGASDHFVRWPFIVEGLLVGLLGALVTLGLLFAASAPISEVARAIAGQVPVGFSQSLTLQVVSLVLLAGLGLGGVGAWISVRAYLRQIT
ncbi:MAG: permease-like cell division protein FtsX [Chloroflexi bacterium]|nr:permease-like cell division protein FtsX [Chloroflexota bacterium]